MTNASTILDAAYLDALFPPTKTDAFFDALFGGAEDGAYDIRLRFEKQTPTELHFAFHLLERPGKCLVCNLTYGLPQVFTRHPVLAVGQTVNALCERLGTTAASWALAATREVNKGLHVIPLVIRLA